MSINLHIATLRNAVNSFEENYKQWMHSIDNPELSSRFKEASLEWVGEVVNSAEVLKTRWELHMNGE